MTALVRCNHVTYHYPDGRIGLNDINLSIAAGEWVVLAGPNGSGKSTLCRVFNGLIPHLHGGSLSGEVRIAGRLTSETPSFQLAQRVGWLGQRFDAACITRSVRHELIWAAQNQGWSRQRIIDRLAEISADWNLHNLLDRNPATLSGGEQARVALAAVVFLRPPLLVLDEPLAMLDAPTRSAVVSTLAQFHQQGTTIICAEHRIEALAQGATRLIRLEQGRIVDDETPFPSLDQSYLRIPQLKRHPAAESASLLRWSHITDQRDGRQLHDISLDLQTAGRVALTGANGSGKTSLLQMALKLRQPQKGRIWLGTRPFEQLRTSEIARKVALVPQPAHSILHAATVRDELTVGPRFLGRGDSNWLEKVSTLCGLEALLERSPYRLSGGEQQRLAVAALLASNPEVLILDEPTSHLDRQGCQNLLELLRQWQQERAWLWVSHDLQWPQALGAECWLLERGKAGLTPLAVDWQPATLPTTVEPSRLEERSV